MKEINLKESVFGYLIKVNKRYVVKQSLKYTSRYGVVDIKKDFNSDGATYFPDINSWFWLVHDRLKQKHEFANGEHCSNHKASVICFDVLAAEKRYILAPVVFLGTWLYGYGKRLIKVIRNGLV